MDWAQGVDRSPVDGSWVVGCWVVDGSWMVGCRVDGGWVRCRLVSWAWVGHTLVFDISHVASIASIVGMVVDNLDAPVWESNPVVSSHQGSVGSLVLAKVDARVFVDHTVLESVRLGWLSVAVGSWVVNGGRVVGCRVQEGSIGSAGQGSDEGSGFGGKHDWLVLSVELLD